MVRKRDGEERKERKREKKIGRFGWLWSKGRGQKWFCLLGKSGQSEKRTLRLVRGIFGVRGILNWEIFSHVYGSRDIYYFIKLGCKP